MQFSFVNKTVVITGAASGIGKIMLRKCLERKAKQIFILDFNEDGMQLVKKEFAFFSIPIHAVVVNLADAKQIENAIKQVLEQTEMVDVLINNAGIVIGHEFVKHSVADIEKTMQINANAPMQLALGFLPQMLEQNSGIICNISSLAGLTSTPKLAVYSASKWAVLGWSEGLRIEMKQMRKKVLIHAVMPFYINTGMFQGVKSKLVPILDPEKTAEKIIRNLEKQNQKTVLPLPYWLIRLAQALLPLAWYDFVMGNVFGIYHTMDDFVGRK
ncbi:SDR family NAD(P)-dependent oxidoreductase [Flavobacterium agricola]|uniref:SDR family NAD(P)-dependent oxidoreductase n=1 Tax=Flavobacterium agricola TaxID=2870839 RepID=A0ABY6LXE6_9FLAO|nr:SDR family NAD(P)-dependent oxidoreductase [Flavobacterium agricola]UYW00841.1 SDR family NAD(P)-dependent oxidoreductase [Flavobacterium agricola]